MSNILVVSIYIPFFIFITMILITFLIRSNKKTGDYMFIKICFLVILWIANSIVGLLTTNRDIAIFTWNFLLIFVGFIPPFLMLFVIDFYRIPLNHPRKVFSLIFAVPIITIFVAVTFKYHSLMYSRLDILSLSPVQEVVRIWGPWFWVHTVHCYAVSIAIISAIFINHFRLPKFYRLPSTLMTIGIAFTLLGNATTLLQLLPSALDPTLIGTSLALIFFNFAIINNDNSKFVRYSLGIVFDYLDLYIIVADEADCVVHINRPALTWFSHLRITLDSLHLNEIIESLVGKGTLQKETENEKGIDVYFTDDPFPVVINIYVQKLADTNGDIIGSIAIFTDVTQNRLLLNRLEDKAGMDALTGIANRMAYNGALMRFDTPEHLPLSVVMCDVNGLKIVNDSLGHQFGDMMLQIISEILEEVCSQQGFVARIGGDEFVLLLSRTTERAATAYMDKIREMMAQRDNLPFTLSVALGAATKESAAEAVADVIALADSRMYENKRWIKSQMTKG